MDCCNQPMNDFSFLVPNQTKRVPNFYCVHCSKHFFRGKWYTPEEWWFYIHGRFQCKDA